MKLSISSGCRFVSNMRNQSLRIFCWDTYHSVNLWATTLTSIWRASQEEDRDYEKVIMRVPRRPELLPFLSFLVFLFYLLNLLLLSLHIIPDLNHFMYQRHNQGTMTLRSGVGNWTKMTVMSLSALKLITRAGESSGIVIAALHR